MAGFPTIPDAAVGDGAISALADGVAVLPELPEIAFAGLVLLLAYFVGSLMTKAKGLFNRLNFSVLGVHLNIGNILYDSIATVPNWVYDWAEQHATPMKNFFNNTGRDIVALGAVGAAVGVNIWDHLEHTAHHTVPAAESAAKSYAHQQALGVQHNLNTEVHTINAGIQGVRNSITNYEKWFNTVEHPAIEHDIVNARMSAINQAEQEAHAQLATTESSLAHALSTLTGQISGLQHAISSTIPKEISAAQAAAEAASSTALQNTKAALLQIADAAKAASAATASELTATVLPELQQLGNKLTAISSTTPAGTGTSTSSLTQQIDAIVTGPIDQVKSQVDALTTTVTQKIDALQTQIDSIPGTTTTSTGVGTVSIAAAVAAIAAQVATLTTEAENCFITACPGPNNLLTKLEALLPTLLSDAAIIAFLKEAISDPAAVSTMIATDAQAAYTTAHSVISTILEI